MEKAASIIRCLLGDEAKATAEAETFRLFKCRAEGKIVSPIELAALQAALYDLEGLTWSLYLHFEDQVSPHALTSSSLERLNEFASDVDAGAADGSSLILSLRIDKPAGSVIQIFDAEAFFSWLNGLTLEKALIAFSELAAEKTKVQFVNPLFVNQATSGFAFTPYTAPISPLAQGRHEATQTRRESILSTEWDTLTLFPDDFIWTGEALEPLRELFARLANFLLVMSLANSTEKLLDGFTVRVIGHVTREEYVKWRDLPRTLDAPLYELFFWCYRASGMGPLSDKISLLRNYMSLYWSDGIFNQSTTVISAVKAGFAIHLKKNLKEFVELRAKVASFLLELDGKASKTVETTVSNLEKNLYGIVTFVTSVVLIKSLQDKTFDGAFSTPVAYLGFALIFISFLHGVYAYRSALGEMNRAEDLYLDLRKLYAAFFSAADFDEIFSVPLRSANGEATSIETPIAKARRYVLKRVRWVGAVWAATLVIVGLVIRTLWQGY